MSFTRAASLAVAAAFVCAAGSAAADGKAVYTQVCAACHAAGLAGAPKLGDKTAWASRVSAGSQAMLASVMKGKGAMPPKAGNASLSDADAKAALDYMLSQVK